MTVTVQASKTLMPNGWHSSCSLFFAPPPLPYMPLARQRGLTFTDQTMAKVVVRGAAGSRWHQGSGVRVVDNVVCCHLQTKKKNTMNAWCDGGTPLVHQRPAELRGLAQRILRRTGRHCGGNEGTVDVGIGVQETLLGAVFIDDGAFCSHPCLVVGDR